MSLQELALRAGELEAGRRLTALITETAERYAMPPGTAPAGRLQQAVAERDRDGALSALRALVEGLNQPWDDGGLYPHLNGGDATPVGGGSPARHGQVHPGGRGARLPPGRSGAGGHPGPLRPAGRDAPALTQTRRPWRQGRRAAVCLREVLDGGCTAVVQCGRIYRPGRVRLRKPLGGSARKARSSPVKGR